jgi:dipeptidase E
MNTSRRTFLKTAVLAGAAATLPRALQAEMTKDGLFPGGPNFQTSPAASVMISGGTITLKGHITNEVRAAHRLHYGARKKILLILHASEPARRDSEEKKLAGLFGEDGFGVESLHHWEGEAARQKIRDAEAFFVGGGETFLLLRTLIESGQLTVLRERVLAGVPYNGSSAGCNIAGPNIGCTNDFPVVDVPSRQSLGIFPGVTNPHHPRTTDADFAGRVNKVHVYCRLNAAETVVGIGNAAVVRLHQGQVTVENGPVFYYHGAEFHELKKGPVPELTALVSAKG